MLMSTWNPFLMRMFRVGVTFSADHARTIIGRSCLHEPRAAPEIRGITNASPAIRDG